MAKLSKIRLHEILSQRFSTGFKKLSDIPNPALLHDGLKAAKRIAHAIQNNEKIYIVGDYDVDGVTSTALMIEFFKAIGYPIEATIPNRFTDGYGVSEKIIDRIEADLVITVDNGINAFGAAIACKKRGIDLIITDHHTPSSSLPDAYAIVDPKLDNCDYPFKEICGAQVAWLLMGLIKKEIGSSVNLSQFMDLLCLAIIADVMPLQDINRTLVIKGLNMMSTSLRPCMVIIRDMLAKKVLSAEDIAFQIAPRVNSAGRMEDASIALEFLTADTEGKAYKQYELLNQLNNIRKSTEAEATENAMQQVHPDDHILVVAAEGWHEGVVGIVASRLVQRFGKPAIVLSIAQDNAKGSARSIGNISIYELIKENEGFLEKFGGHKMAAGLGLKKENISAFKKAINETAQSIPPEDYIPQEEILGEIESSAIDFDLLNLLDEFEPYGEANPRPRFLASNAQVVSIKKLGKDKEHAKIELRLNANDSQTYDLMYFRCEEELKTGQEISCSYTLNKNVFNGRTSIQLMLDRLII
ncbi:single-stranded-DNA-specific exonuclease RecJ [Sulfurimonas sp. MAG313]|nr:single-stranded-DNA-specific exonuclease RecJ [Sulfurimonas sp. MAG313]MDF1882025.1 single-stranded-DNA-specific exonuclease RecJ [Sulfurimonas sp. MAG313]